MARSNLRRIEELQALGRLMGDPAGRRWMRDFLGACHVWDSSYATNAIRMAFLEGERNQGLKLQAEIVEANPEMFLQMLKEYGSERQRGADGAGGDYDPTSGDDGTDSG